MPAVRFERHDALGEIVLDNPPLNLFTNELIDELSAAVEHAAAGDIRALLLRANGDAFSAGADVTIFAGLDEARAQALMSRVLALLHGRCFAGGLEVALACDLIWAATETQIGQLEAVIGGFPFAGGTQRLAARIGLARALEMVFSANVYTAETMAAWGLIGRVIARERLTEEGRAFAGQLAAGPTLAHTATKKLIHAWRSGGVDAADRATRAHAPGVIVSHDLQNGIASLQRSGPGHATFTNR